ncbi:MAG: response regulator transcription factor [Bacteroidetes bacterium]|nr:response regulator transcription factor [Bacteroidota bacterium]MBU1115656.1 response regulator transcription factor [Bacteroidota bacterium]MBU1799031.1 response regulator transcription factor [Bacteroidota bacterium]
MNEITIIIADDHPLFRAGVRSELENQNDFKIVAETGDGLHALHLIEELKPDIAVLDYQMPSMKGNEVTKKLSGINSKTKVVLLTMHNDKKTFLNALESGVQGFVLKDDAVLDIVEAVRKVNYGEKFYSSRLTNLLIEGMKETESEKRTIALIKELTDSERKLLSLIARLKSNDEIADILFISKRTVENNKVAIAHKLLLENSKGLLKFAIENKDNLTEI